VSKRLSRVSNWPAPSGVRPPDLRDDGTADGWITVEASRAERIGERMDSALLRFADGAARIATRRQFLAGAGAVGLAVTAGATGLLRPSRTFAADTVCNVFDPNNNLAGPCGPSPLCIGDRCQDGSCVASRSTVTWRQYGGCDCVAPSVGNCWTENCCGSFSGKFRCCDCCEQDGVGGSCCTCSVPRMKKCICRKKTLDC
jgi:hypothetical protein